MKKQEKCYTVKQADGKLEITLKPELAADGKKHSASCSYPFYVPSGNGQMKRQSRQQTEKMLFENLKGALKPDGNC